MVKGRATTASSVISRDVRVDAERGHAQVTKGAAAEQVQESEDRVVFERLLEQRGVDAGNRYVGDEAEDDQQPDGTLP